MDSDITNENQHSIYAADKAKELTDLLVELRGKSYLSLKQLSNELGLSSHGNITLIEQGKAMPRLDRFLRILSVYGYTLKIVPKETD